MCHEVEKLLVESKNHVQWDGEKFVPKPMQLGKINLVKIRESQTFQDRNVGDLSIKHPPMQLNNRLLL